MEMHQIRYFLAVAEDRNFTRAAEKCNVAQPSLSRAIQLLEAELGGMLFRRERNRTHLSELGEMVRPHLETVYNGALSAKRLSRDLTQMKKVPLKLGIMSIISPDEIVELIAALRTRYDGLELKLCDADSRELRRRLLSGELEVGIYALPGEADGQLHAVPLFREQMMIAVDRRHRLANEQEFPVRELNGECYIHRVNCEFAGYADNILKEKGVTCTPTYWSERDDWTLAMVAAGATPSQLIDSSQPVVEWFRSIGARHVAIHFDLDVIDPAELRSLYFTRPNAAPGAFAGIPQGRMTIPQVVRLLNDVAEQVEVVGLGITEHLPWDAITIRDMLRALPLIGNGRT
jgi:LysR family transcriptional regulator, hydrogen peroxide-inducible genes activator